MALARHDSDGGSDTVIAPHHRLKARARIADPLAGLHDTGACH